MNELLWIGLLVLNFGLILIAYRLFGSLGLIAWMALATIVANIQVTKTIELFGVTATLGNIVYASSFLATDILSEKYGRRHASRAVWIGFGAVVAATLLMSMALFFQPSGDGQSHDALVSIFAVFPRITVASLLAYLISQFHDVWAFQFWRRRVPGKLWLRNNLSTMVSQALDTVVFTAVAFLGVFSTTVFVEILITTYLLKWLVAALDTPLVYWSRRIRPNIDVEFVPSAVRSEGPIQEVGAGS